MEMLLKQKKTLESICARADHPRNDPYGSHVMPIYQTSTFTFKNAEEGRRFFAHEDSSATHSYSRLGNPTVELAEQIIADMEGLDISEKTEGMLFGSGMAAITTGIMALAPGKKILAQETLYGCTSQFLQENAPRFNIEVMNINPNDLDAVENALKNHDDISLVYLESIANPTMRVCDIEQITKLAHKSGAFVMVDNTFATPWHMRPLNRGADLVAHSTTKYLNGHGTLIGGALVARKGFFDHCDLKTYRKNFGGIAGPFEAWLTLMGLKTFALRMKQHNINGKKVAEFLYSHPKISQIWYTGSANHPDSEIIKTQMINGYGGMISFELHGGLEAGIKLMNRVKFASLAVSLGTVDTLIQHPASMTHAIVKPEIRESAGITDGLIRLSVGIESAEDIIADLNQALQ